MLTRSWGKALLIAAMILAALLASAAILQAAHAAEPRTASPAPAVGPHPEQMQEQMRLMQSQMERLGQTTDPAERQRLLDEHLAAMQKYMAGMRGAMMHGHECMPMQQMMDQMMQHQHGMMQAPAAPPPATRKK